MGAWIGSQVFQLELPLKAPERMETLHGYMAGCYDPRTRCLRDKHPAVSMESPTVKYRSRRLPPNAISHH